MMFEYRGATKKMKTAVVYFSYEGNCRLIAETIQAETGADVLSLELEAGKPRKGLAKYVWGGRQVLLRQKPALKPYTFESADYERLIIGTPVWAGSFAPALDTFLDKTRITGKKIALFCCCGGDKGRTFDKLRERLAGNSFAGEIVFFNPSKGDRAEISERVRLWLQGLDW
jgi:flavodoxin